MVIQLVVIRGYQWLLVTILLMAIGGYSINGYSIKGYWWILMVILLIVIVGYYMLYYNYW